MSKITKAHKLHDKICDAFMHILDNGELVETKEGEFVKRSPSAASLKVIVEFLKNNDITGIPVAGSSLGELTAETKKALPFHESEDVTALVVEDRDEF